MQKSLRAGTKRPSPWCSLMLSEALPAQSWDLGDRGCTGLWSPGPGTLGPAWFSLVLLCTVDPDTSHCGLFHFLTNERYVAERHFHSQGTLGENVRSHVFRGNSVAAKCQKAFCLNFSTKNKTHQWKNGTWKTGLQMTFSI